MSCGSKCKEFAQVKRIMAGAAVGLAAFSGQAFAAPATSKGDAAHGQQIFARCSVCHTIGQTGGKMGPPLNGVVGRKAGSVAGYAYSPAMKNSGLTWDAATLARFLQAPMKTVPGTKMFFPGLASPQDQADVVAFLKQYRADGSKK